MRTQKKPVEIEDEELREIYELVAPLVPKDNREELKRRLADIKSMELPEVYTPDLLVNVIGKILEKVTRKKLRKSSFSDMEEEIVWAVKGLYYMTVAPKIKEIIASYQIRRVSGGDE